MLQPAHDGGQGNKQQKCFLLKIRGRGRGVRHQHIRVQDICGNIPTEGAVTSQSKYSWSVSLLHEDRQPDVQLTEKRLFPSTIHDPVVHSATGSPKYTFLIFFCISFFHRLTSFLDIFNAGDIVDPGSQSRLPVPQPRLVHTLQRYRALGPALPSFVDFHRQ